MAHLYKSRLRTYAQKRSIPLPIYTCEMIGPPHLRLFKASVTIDGFTYEGTEFCTTLEDAENAAAKAAYISISPSETEQGVHAYKSLLQELAQKQGLLLPAYATSSSGPPHMPSFVSTVEIAGKNFKGQEARTKKQAEMNAARLAYTAITEDLYKSRLQAYAEKRSIALPVYVCEMQGPTHARLFKACVTIDGVTYEGPEFCTTLEDAQSAAAKVAYVSILPAETEQGDHMYKCLLQELAQRIGLRRPAYATSATGPPHMPSFVSIVGIAGEYFEGQEARTKKQAERNAARVGYTALTEDTDEEQGVEEVFFA